jgi:hypothetical protein
MALTQLIYTSQPFGFDEGMLHGILGDARRCNARDDISGALICRADVYLQLLEGPDAAIDATFARIGRDNRHLEVTLLSRETVTERLFPGWSMRDDPRHTWLWTPEDVAAGALRRATLPALLSVFARVAES